MLLIFLKTLKHINHEYSLILNLKIRTLKDDMTSTQAKRFFSNYNFRCYPSLTQIAISRFKAFIFVYSKIKYKQFISSQEAVVMLEIMWKLVLEFIDKRASATQAYCEDMLRFYILKHTHKPSFFVRFVKNSTFVL